MVETLGILTGGTSISRNTLHKLHVSVPSCLLVCITGAYRDALPLESPRLVLEVVSAHEVGGALSPACLPQECLSPCMRLGIADITRTLQQLCHRFGNQQQTTPEFRQLVFEMASHASFELVPEGLTSHSGHSGGESFAGHLDLKHHFPQVNAQTLHNAARRKQYATARRLGSGR